MACWILFYVITSRIWQYMGSHLRQPISHMPTSRIWVTCGVIFETTNRQHAHIPYFDNIWGQVWNDQSAIVPHTTLDIIWGHIWNDKKPETSLHPVFGSPLMSYLKRQISNKLTKSSSIQQHSNCIQGIEIFRVLKCKLMWSDAIWWYWIAWEIKT